MRFLPVFLDVRSRTIALIGHGTAAQSKLRLLQSAGAKVRWFCRMHDASAQAFIENGCSAGVQLSDADPRQADLSEFVAVIAASGGPLDEEIAARASRRKTPVNVVDRPDLSTFIFPAIVDRGEVIVAIGTGGAAPVLARRLRERIEAVLPARIGELAALLGRFRAQFAQARHASWPLRQFWENVIDGPIGAAVLAGRPCEAEAALARAIESTRIAPAKSGTVFLVGAGPGDPDLLTLRALQALQDADVVLYDERISSEILRRARRDAKRRPVAKSCGAPRTQAREIASQVLAAAHDNLNVVWLKAGDGLLDREQLDYFAQAGLQAIFIPGVTARSISTEAIAA
jgi:uroporphyrin-III C-methyltransferase/precorrin-2 dehydrogenase/sirohydrochlorin ferrochelatase